MKTITGSALPDITTTFKSVRLHVGSTTQYRIGLAASVDAIRAAQTLRFEVFNVELNEGLPDSWLMGRDEDRFDSVCDHLIVTHLPTGSVVGTYRLQSGRNAASHLGYYSAQEFAFEPFAPFRDEIVELGRACVHRDHRNLFVLGLLWKGIAGYAARQNARYLIGCSSLTSQAPAHGASAYSELCRHHLAPLEFRTTPLSSYECSLDQLAEEAPSIPKLLRAYLALGAKICGPPALDREFKTIDFLTLLDLRLLPAPARARFLG